MRILYLVKKFAIEEIRDWKILVFVLIFGPLFVLLFFGIFSNNDTTYKIAVYNKDAAVVQSNGSELNVGKLFLDKLSNEKNSEGSNMFKLIEEKDLNNAKDKIRSKNYDAYVVIPENFSISVLNQTNDPSVCNTNLFIYGDQASDKYMVSAIFMNDYCSNIIYSIIGKSPAVNFKEEAIVDYSSRTIFETSLPAAIFIGVIMILFTAAISLIKEVDSGTIRRLQLSKASSFEVLGAINITQVITGIVEIFLTMFVAFIVLGAKPGGNLGTVFLISLLACISVIPIGFIVAGFSRTVSDILIYGNIPYMLLFIFSGAFPIPRLNILTFFGHTIAINDLLPTTPAMTALKRVMDEGVTLSSVSFEIGLVIVVTVIYYIIGLTLFNQKHMKLA